MPPRRRRTGARPGRLSADLRAAVATEAANLEAAGGPIVVIRAVGDAFAALDAELEVVAQVRLRAVAHLREEGWTYERIAEATGLSKARVAQLSRAAGVAGRGRRRAR